MDEKEKERQRLLLELLPNVSAQLRGALGNIGIAVSRLAPPDVRDENAQMDQDAAILYQSYYRLLRLVNNFSDAAWMLSEEPVALCDRDLSELVGEICQKAEPLAEMLQLKLEFHSELKPHRVAVNPEGLERLLLNLLSNAFKFTPAGGSVTVELKAAQGWIKLLVTDTGCGISDELMPTLFDRYNHSQRRDPYPHGLGLGLSICKRIAQAHGGTIMARSAPGEWTQIIVSLPDQRSGNTTVSDLPFDYAGGFNRTLLELSDALPVKCFTQRHTD